MPLTPLFANRRLRVAYWDSEAKFTNMEKVNLEHALKSLAEVDIKELASPSPESLQQLDLVIIAAHKIPQTHFVEWLRSWIKRMHQPETIWVPAIIVAPVEYKTLAPLVAEVAARNWYFDVAHPDELNSLPIRIANLVRIHDHLRELERYDAEVRGLESKVANLEAKLRASP